MKMHRSPRTTHSDCLPRWARQRASILVLLCLMLVAAGCRRECECDRDDTLVTFDVPEEFGVGSYSGVLTIDEEVAVTCMFELDAVSKQGEAACDDATVEVIVTRGEVTYIMPEVLDEVTVSLTVTGTDGVWAGSTTIKTVFETRLDNCLCLYGLAIGKLIRT